MATEYFLCKVLPGLLNSIHIYQMLQMLKQVIILAQNDF
jgi:hypothetical protein